jgi:hypothetical protein
MMETTKETRGAHWRDMTSSPFNNKASPLRCVGGNRECCTGVKSAPHACRSVLLFHLWQDLLLTCWWPGTSALRSNWFYSSRRLTLWLHPASGLCCPFRRPGRIPGCGWRWLTWSRARLASMKPWVQTPKNSNVYLAEVQVETPLEIEIILTQNKIYYFCLIEQFFSKLNNVDLLNFISLGSTK